MIGFDFQTIRGMGIGIEFPDTSELEYEDDDGQTIPVKTMVILDILILRILIIGM